MEWKTLPTDSSATNTNSNWLYSFDGGSHGYRMTLTNLVDAYEERFDSQEVQDRCGDLNPAVEASTEDLTEEIGGLLTSNTSNIQLEETKDGATTVTVNGKLFGYDFRWRFDLTRLSSEGFHTCVVSQLVRCVSHLFTQQEYLAQTLQAKDLELADYEYGGATLTRKNAKTERFDRAQLNKVPVEPASDLTRVVASDKFRSVQSSVAHGKRATPVKATSAEERSSRERERRKRIRIKGAGQLFKDEEEEDDCSDRNRSSSSPSPKKPTVAPTVVSAAAKKKQAVAKKLKKL